MTADTRGKTKSGATGLVGISLGLGALAAGIIILAFPELGLFLKVLVLSGGLLLVGVAKVSTSRRGRHLTPLLRRFGLGVGLVTIALGALVLASALIATLAELFPDFPDAFPDLVEAAALLAVGLLLIILAGILVLYGLDRIFEGYGALLPRGERIALVGIGSASIILAVLTLVFPTFGETLILLILVFALFATGLGALLVGLHTLGQRTIQEPVPSLADVGEAVLEAGWEPEARLHCLVVGSRKEIVASLQSLAGKADLKFQQGALQAARKENLDEDPLFERLRAYADHFGDLEPREGEEEWSAIHEEFDAYQRTASRKKFQWLRPIGALTSKVRVTRIVYVLRKTPIDLAASGGALSIGGSWRRLRQAVQRSRMPVTEEFLRQTESEFALFKGGLPAKGAYILHIVGLPVDVDSEELGDIYDDDATLLWDFGASHTEVGALDPADHLMSSTTNFLLGPAILFQHFFDEGRPVALIHKQHFVRAEWAGRRVVTHISDTIDVELAFKQGKITLPNPIARGVRAESSLPPDAIGLHATQNPGRDPVRRSEEGDWEYAGISAGDLREQGFERIDWDLVRAMMETDDGPSPT